MLLKKSTLKIHFIAIGGSIMHNLAICLRKMGHHVSGSDDEIFEPAISQLKKNNLLPEKLGWSADKITDNTDLVVLGMHAKKDNPELKKAIQLNIKIVSFPELIADFSKNKKRIVIAGSHGKTTTTSILMHVFKENKINFDYLVGARIDGFENMVKLTEESEYILIEGDEYLSSPLDNRPKFFHYKPQHTIITGIAWDHINVFPTEEIYLKTFKDYLETLTNATVVYFKKDENIDKVISGSTNKLKFLPYSTPEYKILDDKSTIKLDDEYVELSLFGKHNFENINAAYYLWKSLGFEGKKFREKISSFSGPALRLENWYTDSNYIFIRDFAHAPSKVQASINAVTEHYNHFTKIAVIELHTFSSLTESFLPHYKETTKGVDKVFIFFDEKALELKGKQIPTEKTLKEAFNRKDLVIIKNKMTLKEEIIKNLIPKTIFLLMSSGKLDGFTKTELKEVIK
ncbi:MAG: peptidoglycan synthetase [Chitinophagaceae bacterium]|nr:MAG: peptidoglycan synthetase [Chitinophagaceae bacterium]